MTAKTSHRSILTYAHWRGMDTPTLVGILHAAQVRGKEVFSFAYDEDWLKTQHIQNLDPDLQLYSGPQFLREEKTNFGIFSDSSPDRWGRALMKRREAVIARRDDRPERTLFETDYLLGVFDLHRMGGLRFKEAENEPFLNNNRDMAAPPWTSLRELEQASWIVEHEQANDPEYLRWLNLLIAPGSSLGGARPKASVIDTKGQLWIAKFPSKNDQRDTGAWEMTVQKLGMMAGVVMAEAMSKTFVHKHHTFLTKRFDRNGGERIHFASAMTLLGYTDGADFQSGASYLELAEFVMRHGAHPDRDLEELWRRIVFFISVSNTDDHLRNHGFLLTNEGWTLSPAYDVNPVENATGLSLNISENDNSLAFELALDVARYFRVSEKKAKEILEVVKKSIGQWKAIAEKEGIPASERDAMSKAFKMP